MPLAYDPVAQALVRAWPGLRLEVADSIDSTNAELMRRTRDGQTQAALLVARQQTAGRGRLGRQWLSAAGVGAEATSLTFSLSLPLAPHDWAGLSLAVGVSLAESLHPELRLKWPNDLWLDGRKLGGVLIETAGVEGRRQAIIGVGINLGWRDGSGLARAPAWLGELLPGIDAPGVLLRLAEPLLGAITEFESLGFAPFHARFEQRDALRGTVVALNDGTVGEAQGVNGSGALMVRTAQGLQAVSSAEISLRGPAGTSGVVV